MTDGTISTETEILFLSLSLSLSLSWTAFESLVASLAERYLDVRCHKWRKSSELWWSADGARANGLANGGGGERREGGRGVRGLGGGRRGSRARASVLALYRELRNRRRRKPRPRRFRERRHRIAVRSICLNKSCGELQSRQAGRELAAGVSHSKKRGPCSLEFSGPEQDIARFRVNKGFGSSRYEDRNECCTFTSPRGQAPEAWGAWNIVPSAENWFKSLNRRWVLMAHSLWCSAICVSSVSRDI
jgi:hypothetical protein